MLGARNFPEIFTRETKMPVAKPPLFVAFCGTSSGIVSRLRRFQIEPQVSHACNLECGRAHVTLPEPREYIPVDVPACSQAWMVFGPHFTEERCW
jgi:hypothetical protein